MRATLRLFIVAFALSLPLAGMPASASYAAAPNVGEAPPHDLSLPDQNGQRMNYMARAKSKGLIVLFTRSVGW